MKYILGSGISALLFAYYNRDYNIIATKSMGKLGLPAMNSTIVFHESERLLALLKELGIDHSIETHYIEYFSNGEKIDIANITTDDKIAFVIKKTGFSIDSIKDTTMSTKDCYINTIKFDTQLLLDKLVDATKSSFIYGNIIRISDSHIVCEDRKIAYDRIVSTLPAFVFEKLYGINYDLVANDATFAVSKTCPIEFKDQLYCLSGYNFTRVSKKDDQYLYEYTGLVDKEVIERELKVDIIDHFCLKNSIISTKYIKRPPNILFLGRFAMNDHSFKINDSLDFAVEHSELDFIFERQKSFCSNFVDYSNTNPEYMYDNLKRYTNLIFPEVAEMLNCIPFKEHKDIVPDITSMQVEGIDIFKYLLNVLIVSGLDARGFIKIFNSKSTNVEMLWTLRQQKNSAK